MSVPIPERKPEVPTSGFSWDTVGDALGGLFNKGLDLVSQQLAFEKQIELQKYTAAAADTATQASTTGIPQTAQPVYTSGGFSLGTISPVTIALLAAAGFILIKK